MTQDQTCSTFYSTEHQIKECTKEKNILVKCKGKWYTFNKRELKEIMGEYGKLKSVRSRKIDYGRSFNENICFTNEQEAEAAIIKIN